MNMLPRAPDESLLFDRVQKTGCGAVVENIGRDLRLVFQIDIDAVALPGSDLAPIL